MNRNKILLCLPLLWSGVWMQAAPAQAPAAPTGTPAMPQPAPQPAAQPAAAQPTAQSQPAGYVQEPYASPNEPQNPQMFGMEIPLLDPSSDTVSYNGAKFDVGNNALVRARFEKYLQQNPENSSAARAYRRKMEELLKVTQRTARTRKEVGSETLLLIGNGLYEMNEYPGDAGQSGTLASAIASAVSVQYANRARKNKNEKLEAQINELVQKTNFMHNTNALRNRKTVNSRGESRGGNTPPTNTFLMAHNTKRIAGMEATSVKNDADNITQTELSKINYQSVLVSFLMNRRFDHALIGACSYRHIYRDGDTMMKLDKESKASELFEGTAGLPPTVNSIASMAAGARHDVDQNMDAVANLLAQNRLADATQHLIQAVAIGEYMKSVATFPVEGRRRIAEYWSLRKKALSSMNARDYGTLEQISARMKELDPDFDDSMLVSYCTARKQQSDMCLRNAMKAMQAGDEEAFNRHITEAGVIWPRNPNLQKGRERLEKLDNQDPVREEFKTLVARKDFRTIYNEQERFEVVAIDPNLKKQYKEVITLIGTIDGMLEQLDKVAEQDRVMGPCMAYETLLERREQDERFADDSAFRDALNRYALGAHDFVKALEDGAHCEERGEYGSALANYYRAQCLYPRSAQAEKGARRVSEVILKSKF
ncbi:MAG: hypothetical protein IKK45_05835 [Akkermansia sp.]|nr:hypothetical protein [Akkermansia sp.]